MQVTWRRRLNEIIRGKNNFVFNAFLYLEPVQRFENTVRIGGRGSCNNSTSKTILDILKAISLRLRKTIVHQIAVVKFGVNKRCVDGASRIKVKNRAYATKITDVVETCTRDRRDVIGKRKMKIKIKTEVTSRGSRRNQVTISEKKNRIVDFI